MSTKGEGKTILAEDATNHLRRIAEILFAYRPQAATEYRHGKLLSHESCRALRRDAIALGASIIAAHVDVVRHVEPNCSGERLAELMDLDFADLVRLDDPAGATVRCPPEEASAEFFKAANKFADRELRRDVEELKRAATAANPDHLVEEEGK